MLIAREPECDGCPTASAGVSYNKFLAKMASDQRKPDGLFVITPKQDPAFVEALPVKKFHGVGPATAEKMLRLGIQTGADRRFAIGTSAPFTYPRPSTTFPSRTRI